MDPAVVCTIAPCKGCRSVQCETTPVVVRRVLSQIKSCCSIDLPVVFGRAVLVGSIGLRPFRRRRLCLLSNALQNKSWSSNMILFVSDDVMCRKYRSAAWIAGSMRGNEDTASPQTTGRLP